MKTSEKIKSRERRHRKIRTKISGTKERPRLSFFKSNKRIYVQLVDDENGKTFFGVSSDKVKGATMTEKAKEIGKLVAKLALGKKIKSVVFDRGGFLYSGKIKAFADGAREGGLKV
ncbi:MAG: 50S ribosomal protein L18 [Candidatus Pacebacteria bacterium]|jgi:large subunit ribosomal protein L18|nr:50S ribosomal protein L18 [Candidatus Paceibacterota bacterium]|tara:strand:+ start:11617 stop:11964 length:348 start_codon:yes stop_codon:yes gene_type:complete